MSFPARSLQWGWQIQCAHPDCTQQVTEWSPKGTPRLPLAGVACEGPLRGWFVRYKPAEHGYGHVAFCPEHSPKAVTWLAAIFDWQNQRREVGRTTSKSLWDRLVEWMDPARALSKAYNHQIWQVVQTWEKQNPRPIPPWEVST